MILDRFFTADHASLHFDALAEQYEWVRDMAVTPQDPRYHGEGDVWTHTRMVCEAVTQDEEWPSLSAAERRLMLTAALMHDSGKPQVTFTDETGRIRSPDHAWRGEILSRRILWEHGEAFQFRETVAALVRQHMQPRFLPEQRDPRRRLYAMSYTLRCDLLAMLARADARGRIGPDTELSLAKVAEFVELCHAHDCLRGPRAFRSDHARFLYFRRRLDDPDADAAPPQGPTITLMSGLPGSGKDTWVAAHGGDQPVISLDAIRLELGIKPTEEQEEVVRTARERALSYVREGRPFIWNATTLGRKHRRELIDLLEPYEPRIRMVYLDAPSSLLHDRNEGRPPNAVVPRNTIDRMSRIWSPPDLTECHELVQVLHALPQRVQREAAD